jgi:sodium/hydrogen antiporter
LLEVLTEVAVLISLFSAGIKMPVPVTTHRWVRPVLLAWVSMALTVAMVALFAHYFLGLSLGLAVLLGAILAPTDPVLATDVQSRHPGDKDHLRFNLTCEAGMNDGTAFPFVMLGLGMLGLHDLGEGGWKWFTLDVLWATSAAIAIGILGGMLVARIGWKLRSSEYRHEILDDLAGLGLIALVYGASLMVDAWGFLTVFFAGVALRQTELKLTERYARQQEAVKQNDYASTAETADPEQPIISVESLIFGAHLERLSEMLLVFLLGGMLAFQFWNWQTVSLALFLFLVARPLSVFVSLAGTSTSWKLRGMLGWFGVRGIGSLYYLMYAIQHGLDHRQAEQLIQIVLVVVTLSIILHGTSVKPIMEKFWRR